MRKCITGHVGDVAFRDVLRSIESGPTRSTLFVHGGTSEKVIHFSEERLLLLELPGSPQAAEGPAASIDADAAPALLRKAFQELCGWQGATFELREGPVGTSLELHPKVLKLAGAASQICGHLSGLTTPADGGKAATAPRSGAARLARAEDLLKQIPIAFSKQLLLRELAQIWKESGSVRRAATAMRDLARQYSEWGAEENACEILEQALELCPLDLGVAEDLINLSQSAGRQKQAERAAEQACAALDKLKLQERVVELYRLLERSAESVSLRRLGAEALIKSGDLVQGVRELTAAAAFLESRGEEEGALQIHERIVELDPSNTEARERVRKARRHQVVSVRLHRSATLMAATLLFVLWFSWDVSSASAFAQLKKEGLSREPRAAVDLVRQGAGSFPGTRYAGRLAGFEEELFRESFERDKKNILSAVAAQDSGDLDTAAKLFRQVAEGTLVAPLGDRARAGLDEIERRRSRADSLLEQAARLVKARDFQKAFGVYRDLILGSRDEVLASSYSVPVLVETVPQGASIRLDGQDMGRTPRWVFVPSDPKARLVLSMPTFENYELVGPLAPLLGKNDSRLRAVLVPSTSWKSSAFGGELAGNASPDSQRLVVLGADGVLRAFEPPGQKRWETPVEAGARSGLAPFVSGPAVVLGMDAGKVTAFSLASGKSAWSYRIGADGGLPRIGPAYRGQLIVSSAAGAALLNPQTGLVCRRLGIAPRSAVRFQSAVGDLGVFALENGDVIGAELTTGSASFERPGLLADAAWIVMDGENLISAAKNGRVTAVAVPGCETVWEATFPGELRAACIPEPGRVCVGSPTGVVVCLDSRNGQPVWKTMVEGAVAALHASPTGVGGIIVARVARDGEASACAISTAAGKIVWELKAGRGDAVSARFDSSRVAVSSPTLGVAVLKAQ